ncbi:MAG: amidohydrolase, partial [bacterium]
MNSGIQHVGFVISILLSLIVFQPTLISGADLVIIAGSIYTLDPQMSTAEAVAVSAGRIAYVGSKLGAEKYISAETVVLHEESALVLPGLTDAHAHLFSLGRSLNELNLTSTTSSAEIRQLVLEQAANLQTGSWICGRGWDQNDWQIKEFPTFRDLEGVESYPVYLRRVDGHAAWVNKTALELCGIDRHTLNPPGGRILRDADGNPTGVLIDNAIELVKLHLPLPTRDERLARTEAAIRECHRYGLTGVHDAGVDAAMLETYRELHRQGKLTLRINAVLSSEDTLWLEHCLLRGPQLEADGYLNVRSVKLYADGALGSRGAALLEPYSDEPGQSGLLMDRGELYRLAHEAWEHGFQVCTHAIGDAANRMVLDVYSQVLSQNAVEDRRWRIEHAQVIALSDFARFASLKVIPSLQPTHATSDMPWVETRLGSKRTKGAYAWRTLLELGCPFPCGSDFPVESPNPLWGIYAAVTRQDHQGHPEGGWHPEQRMTIQEAIRGFTLD